MATKKLHGLALKNFRGIGVDFNEITPFGRINFFIGPNNSGKSTVLLFISNYLTIPQENRNKARSYHPLDIRLNGGGSTPEFKIGNLKSDFIKEIASLSERTQDNIRRIIDAMFLGDTMWVKPQEGRSSFALDYDYETVKKAIDDMQWRATWSELSRMHGGSPEVWVRQTIDILSRYTLSEFDEVHCIPAIREISEKGKSYDDMSGKGLIDKLAELQNPAHTEREMRLDFDKINQFLRSVTSSNDAQIEIPHDRRHILVHIDNKVLPLSSLGTGIHEVIMIASFCTLTRERIICIEEPEIHLHPILQRKLISYLHKETANQYFIATHSPSLLDAVPASIFSISNEKGETRIERVATSSDRFEICKRMGYHASDLLQSNAVIWVEGPSDRIYLKHWIESSDSSLTEGVHYSIMFYGGRLLSHLAFDDPEVTDFINLRRLNRNSIVMIDSDRKNSRTPINATKDRILKELGGDHCWITKGREIENYVPVPLMTAVLSSLFPTRFKNIFDEGTYGHRLHFKDLKGEVIEQVDKVKVALAVCRHAANLTELDLKPRIANLISFIHDSNPIR